MNWSTVQLLFTDTMKMKSAFKKNTGNVPGEKQEVFSVQHIITC